MRLVSINLYPGDHADPVHEAEEEEPGAVRGRVQDEAEAARADGAEAPQQLEDDAEPREDEAVQVARADVLVERGQRCGGGKEGIIDASVHHVVMDCRGHGMVAFSTHHTRTRWFTCSWIIVCYANVTSCKRTQHGYEVEREIDCSHHKFF